MSEKVSVLFVCLGNICRSPMAEGAFQHLVNERGLMDQFNLDSAGTGGWHAGEPPDPRSIRTAQKHGVDINQQRSLKKATMQVHARLLRMMATGI